MRAGSPARDAAASLIALLFAIQFAAMAAMEMSGPFWPVHFLSLGAEGALFRLASIAVYIGPMLGILLTSAFWGRIGDRYGHKLMMIRALLGLALTQLALAYAEDALGIVALRFLQGACAGFIAPAQAYGIAVTAGQDRGSLFARLQIATNLGSLLGAIAGGVILDAIGFKWINLAAAAVCGACAVAAAVCLPPVPGGARASTKESGRRDAERRWLAPSAVALLAAMGMLLVARLFTLAPFSLYVRATFGVDNWVAGLSYGLLALGFILTASAWARHLKNKTSQPVLRVVTGIALACAVLTVCAAATRDVRMFVLLHLAWGMLLGATTPVLSAMISAIAPADQQGRAMGIVQGTVQFSSIAGIALGGLLAQGSRLPHTYLYVAALYGLAAVVVALARRFCAGPAAPPGGQG